jgi:AhpD family alkylhydroperoxidase
MKKFNVPTRGDVSETNQKIFDDVLKQIGMVPNLYATMAISPTALNDFLTFVSRKSSLNKKEQEVVNLSVSAANGCTYCQSAHTVMGKMNGFNDNDIIEFRKGFSSNSKYNALAQIAKAIVIERGNISENTKKLFFDAGYNYENLIDVIYLIADKTITNYMYAVFDYPIDFPIAEKI